MHGLQPQSTCMGPTRAMRWLTVMYILATAAAEDQCDGPVLRLLVQDSRYTPARTLYGVLASFGGIPSFNLSQPVQLLAADPLNACAPLQQHGAPGAVYLVQRGNCSFTDKYQAAVAAGGSGMILFDDIPGCITMGGVINGSAGNSSSGGGGTGPAPPPPARNASDPAAISVPRSDGLALLSELRGGAALRLQFQLLDIPALDASALLLWLMAVGTVVAGSLWCGADYACELRGGWWGALSAEDGAAAQHGGGGGRHSSGGGGGGLEVLEVTMAGAVGFVAVSSAMLLLLYFFLNKAFFFIILAGFALAGAQALTLLLLPLLGAALPALSGVFVALPTRCCCGGRVSVTELLAAPLAVAAAVTWALARNAAWSWVLQDLLGVAIMLLVLRTLRLPNLRVACVLLPLCFAYDVFWVFIQPLLTGPGSPSVMVEVASGVDSHEFLPMLLRVPRLSGPPIIRGAYSLLGFGDVILPGLLVALARRMDIAMAASAAAAAAAAPASAAGSGPAAGKRARRRAACGAAAGRPHSGYFVPAVMGYGAGLLLTYGALLLSLFGDQGQPALLYLVPCTLGVVVLLAACRGELADLMAIRLDPEEEEEQEHAGGDGEDGGGGGGALQVDARGGAGADDDEEEEEEEEDGGGGGTDEQRVALLVGGRRQRARAVAHAPGPVAEGVDDWQRLHLHLQQQEHDAAAAWGGLLAAHHRSSEGPVLRSSRSRSSLQRSSGGGGEGGGGARSGSTSPGGRLDAVL